MWEILKVSTPSCTGLGNQQDNGHVGIMFIASHDIDTDMDTDGDTARDIWTQTRTATQTRIRESTQIGDKVLKDPYGAIVSVAPYAEAKTYGGRSPSSATTFWLKQWHADFKKFIPLMGPLFPNNVFVELQVSA
jgi:hypothetical protein